MCREREHHSKSRTKWTSPPFVLQLTIITFDIQDYGCQNYATQIDSHEHIMEENLQKEYPINGFDPRSASLEVTLVALHQVHRYDEHAHDGGCDQNQF